MPLEINATLEVVSPLFTGGVQDAQSVPRPELRAQSIKGLLRFWYRALHPPTPANPDPRSEELRIFGGADDAHSGQAVFRLSFVPSTPPISFVPAGLQQWPNVFAYLGYAFIGPAPESPKKQEQVNVTRAWIRPGTQFTLEFRFGLRARHGDADQVMSALWALCTFGGIGGRSRRGWGSVRLVAISDSRYSHLQTSATSPAAFLDELRRNVWLSGDLAPNRPPYSAFSAESRVVATQGFGTDVDGWKDALRSAGIALRNWRSSSGDGALVRTFVETGKIASHPPGDVFGLPHNYFFKDRHDLTQDPERVNIEAERNGSPIHRRASPLFLSVKRLPREIGGVQHTVLHTFLPARFLPDTAQIHLVPDTDTSAVKDTLLPFNEDYGPIEDFLDNLSKGRFTTSLLPGP